MRAQPTLEIVEGRDGIVEYSVMSKAGLLSASWLDVALLGWLLFLFLYSQVDKVRKQAEQDVLILLKACLDVAHETWMGHNWTCLPPMACIEGTGLPKR